ncbi:MAG: MarR family transcriptional regulator [Ilumatobacteraceae bacterium]
MATLTPDPPTPGAAPHVAALEQLDVDRLRLVLLRLARRIRTNSVEVLTPSQLAVLATVIRHRQLTIGQIAEFEHVKPPSVSKIVAALEQAGFVERQTDAVDRRCSHIAPTAAGASYLDEVRAAGRTWLASQMADLDAAEIADIATALPALERVLGGAE